MINKLLINNKEVNEFLKITAKESLTKVMNNKNVDLVSINVTETPDEWFKKQSLSKINNIEKEKNSQQKEIIAPSINNVQSGKSIIKLNQKGDSVKEIQKMLYDLGYDYLINNFETLQKWNDGIYGKGTKMAVETFQEDNGLKADGIVNKQTLSKLKEVYNSKIDEKKQ
jgi:peptidoglycan hydrolase-like protein with peptidoglycan-binding domain